MDSVDPLEALPEATFVIDRDGAVISANSLAVARFGYDPTGAAVGELLNEHCLDRAGDVPVHVRVERGHGDRVPFIAEVSVAGREWQHGHRLVLLHELDRDGLLGESQRLLDLAFERSPVGMAFFNPAGEYIRVNPALCRFLDRPAATLVGRRDQEFTHPDDRQSDFDAAWRILDGQIDTWQTEKRFVRPDGSIVWAIANLTFLRDEERRPVAWLGQFQDITERKTLEERLRRLADEDPLTCLSNRRSFEEAIRLALELGARDRQGGAMLMIDLDGFKEINDTHGHACGDAALAAVAEALRARLRAGDLLARVGGDEFAVLLRGTAAQHAGAVADSIIDVVRHTKLAPGLPDISLNASVGIATYGAHPMPTVDGCSPTPTRRCIAPSAHAATGAERAPRARPRPGTAGSNRSHGTRAASALVLAARRGVDTRLLN